MKTYTIPVDLVASISIALDSDPTEEEITEALAALQRAFDGSGFDFRFAGESFLDVQVFGRDKQLPIDVYDQETGEESELVL